MCVSRIVLCATIILSGYSEISATEVVAEHHPHRLHHNGIRKYRALSAVPEGPLRFNPTPYGKNLELHSAGKIHCKVAGGKNPVVQWFLNAEDALPEGVTSINGTLQISEAAKSHSGNYTCLVTDDEKKSINTTIPLVVVVSPRVLEPQAGLEMHVTDGEDVWLHCRAAGDPVPTTLWDMNTTILSVDLNDVANENSETFEIASKVLFANGSLLLRNVSSNSAAKYGCTAGSAAGMARNDVLLVVHPEGVLSTPSTGVAGKAVVISISVALAYMLLVLALMLYCRHRRERLARNRGDKIELEVAEGREKLVEDEEAEKPKRNGVLHNGRLLTHDSGADNSEVSAASRASKRSGQYDHLSVPRTLLTETITLGRGEFGDVMLAKIDLNHLKKLKNKDISDSCSTPKLKPVLVKALSVKDENQLVEFRRNLDMFSRVRDECVVRVLGLCNDEDPHYLLLDHTDWGDFKQFLISTRSAAGVPLSAVQAVVLAGHAARGAAAIAGHRHTHRDIAARNCVITSKLQLKISFPAMSRGPYAQEYYKMHDQVIPLRWLPSEAVLEADYSSKSDVYMFAVTVWEIYTKAELPFAKLNDNSVMERLKNGTLEWTIPDTMPEKLATLLKKCWSKSPTDRPQFDSIVAEMKTILQELMTETEPASETVEVNEIENAEVV